MNYSIRQLDKKIRSQTRLTDRTYHKLLVWCIRLVVVTTVSAMIVGSIFGYGSIQSLIDNTKDISYTDITPTGFMTRIYDADGNLMQTLVTSGANREKVTLSQIPKNLVNAFIAIEDERFWEHNGIDLKGILRAGVIGITSGRFSEGASTITQQLIKNSIFNGGLENSLGERIERKVQEQALALRLEQNLSKSIILETYLNTINLGNNTLGVQAAAKRYFNKHVSELTLSECAVIAAITQNPSKLNPIRYPDKNKVRQTKILDNMLMQGMISKEEHDEALADEVYDRIYEKPVSSPMTVYSYFTDSLIDSVLSDLQNRLGYSRTKAVTMLYSGGLTIETTLDPKMQEIMEEEVNNPQNYPYTQYAITYKLSVMDENGVTRLITQDAINEYGSAIGLCINSLYYATLDDVNFTIAHYKEEMLSTSDIIVSETLSTTLEPQLSMVIIDQANGHIKAMVGGRGPKEASLTLNRATDSTRQPGSCFKVLSTFAPAIDTMGMTLASTYYDSPYVYNEHSFNNWWGDDYLGFISIRDCIAYSMNLGTLHCLMDTVSIKLAYDYLEKFGITTLVQSRKREDGSIISDLVPSICLGGLVDGVTNLELTNAYATIANQGVYTKPVYYTRILDNNGKVLLSNEPEQKKVLKSTTASLLTYAMESTMLDASESKFLQINPNIIPTGGDCAFPNMHIAGKSGSTTNNNDLWFVGFTPYYTCGIWSGYDIGKSDMSGGIYHKLIWKNVMQRIHQGKSDINWPENKDIVTARVCSKSGLLAREGICNHESSNAVVYTEYFSKNTVPTKYCDCHVKYTICEQSGLPVSKYCPLSESYTKVYMLLDESLSSLELGSFDEKYLLPEEFKDQVCTEHDPVEETTEEETNDTEDVEETQESMIDTGQYNG